MSAIGNGFTFTFSEPCAGHIMRGAGSGGSKYQVSLAVERSHFLNSTGSRPWYIDDLQFTDASVVVLLTAFAKYGYA